MNPRGARSIKPIAMASLLAALAAVTSLVAYWRWPYAYYETFRWVIAASALAAAYLLRSKPICLVVCAAVLFVFNPIAPMRMRAYEWRRYDIASFISMSYVAIYAWRLRGSSPTASSET